MAYLIPNCSKPQALVAILKTTVEETENFLKPIKLNPSKILKEIHFKTKKETVEQITFLVQNVIATKRIIEKYNIPINIEINLQESHQEVESYRTVFDEETYNNLLNQPLGEGIKKQFEEYAENIPTEYKEAIGLLLKITKDQIQDLDQQIESLTFLRDSRKPLLQVYENLLLEVS